MKLLEMSVYAPDTDFRKCNGVSTYVQNRQLQLSFGCSLVKKIFRAVVIEPDQLTKVRVSLIAYKLGLILLNCYGSRIIVKDPTMIR